MKVGLGMRRFAELGVAATAVAVLIAGCGGGSSSPGVATINATGIVADGYLSNVKVCLDKNSNTVCDAGEPSATTDLNGAYSIPGVTATDVAAFAVVAEVPSTSVDKDTGSAVGKSFVLTTPAGKSFISPITSIAHQMMKDSPASSVAAITTQLNTDMQIAATFDPFADYVADEISISASSAVSATAHKFAKVVANSMMENNAVVSGVSTDQKGALQSGLVKIAKLAAQSQGATPNPAAGIIGVEDFNTVRATLANKLTTGAASQAVTVNFDVLNGATPVKACDPITLNNLQLWDKTPLTATTPSAAIVLTTPVAQTTAGQMVDLRFYISNVLLWDANGNAVPLVMTEDASQSKNIALMDFGHNTALAGAAPTCSTTYKTSITGNVVAGTYTGVSFTLGVPVRSADLSAKLNHSNVTDVVNTPIPLQNAAMGWSWQSGHKFTKIEFMPTTPLNKPSATNFGATTTIWYVHLGSTGCAGNPVAGAETACLKPNKLGVKLSNFNPATNTIALDLAALFAEADLTYDAGGPPGCMSGTDAECTPIFKSLGIGQANGRTLGTQAVFSVK